MTFVVLSVVASPTQTLKVVSLANREENVVTMSTKFELLFHTRFVEEMPFSVPLHFFSAKKSSTTRSAVENWSYTQVAVSINSFIPHLTEISARGSAKFGKKVRLKKNGLRTPKGRAVIVSESPEAP